MYDAKITSAEPTLLVILLDQSSSMDTTLVETKGERFSIARMAKYVVDEFLYEAFNKCIREDELKPYLDIAVIGYGDGIHSALPKIPLEQFPFSVKKLEDTFFAKNDSDPDDNSVIPKPRLEWIEERADGYSPMLAAFTKAREIVEKWLPDHQESLPPFILNISDGTPSDDDIFNQMFQEAAENFTSKLGDISQTHLVIQSKAIQDMGTDNGKCLVLNCHISARGQKAIQYPSSIDEAENIDPFAKLMFEMSSIIPAPFLGGYNNLQAEPGARFYTLNADFDSGFYFKTGGSEARFDPK